MTHFLVNKNQWRMILIETNIVFNEKKLLKLKIPVCQYRQSFFQALMISYAPKIILFPQIKKKYLKIHPEVQNLKNIVLHKLLIFIGSYAKNMLNLLCQNNHVYKNS